MNKKRLLYSLTIMLFSFGLKAQFGCDCVLGDSTTYVCAQDSLGNIYPVPNECFANCFGLTIIEGDDCLDWNDPWAECDCEINPEEEHICATDSNGVLFLVPNACVAECFNLTVNEDNDCFQDPWGDCDCTLDSLNGDYICAQDSFGNIFPVPNACFAECWGLTVVEDGDCFGVDPWEECNCEIEDPFAYICVTDSFGNYFTLPNECIATCLGYTVADSADCNIVNPWECDCPITDTIGYICAVDTMGYYYQVPNECFADCWGLEVVDNENCEFNDDDWWTSCECAFNENEPFVCAQDSLGHIVSVPNACYAACWGLTLVDDSLCNVTVIDENDDDFFDCVQNAVVNNGATFQELLLAVAESCNIELPACILDAPIFESDSLYFAYIYTACNDTVGFNPGNAASNVANMFNMINAIASSTNDGPSVENHWVKLSNNPVDQTLNYTIHAPQSGNFVVQLLDINGRTMTSTRYDLNEGSHTLKTDVSNFPSGLYLMNVVSNKVQTTIKVVVAH